MDKVTAISLVLSVAREHSSVDVFQELSSIDQANIDAIDISSPAEPPASLWRIQFGNKSLLLKQGCVLSPPDAETCLEYESLAWHYKLVPSFTPRPYCWTPQHQSIVLEDLKDYSGLYDELLASRVDMVAIRKLGESLGQLHKLSHAASNSIVVRDLMRKFHDNPTATNAIRSRFVDALSRDRAASLTDGAVKQKLLKLLDGDLTARIEQLTSTLVRRHECLSHALLDTAAIKVKDGDVKLFGGYHATFYSPCSFDVAMLLADYIDIYYEHMLTPLDNDNHRQVAYKMVDACHETVAGYLEQMTVAVDGREQYVAALMSDAASYCGLQLIARAVQRSEAATDAESRSKAVEILNSGQRLLTAAGRIHNVGFLANIALMLTT